MPILMHNYRDERDTFQRRSGYASHGTKAAAPNARLVDVPRSFQECLV